MELTAEDLLPTSRQVLQAQGVDAGATVRESVHAAVDKSLEAFISTAAPVSVIDECSVRDFKKVYRGEGKNAAESPLKAIFPKSDRLDLFAITMGQPVASKIRHLFETGDFPAAVMLDSVASLATEKAVSIIEWGYQDRLTREGSRDNHLIVLGYSPGYCGWDISGQKKLFEYLHPEKIGIRLNDSYLMDPLKSATGVLVAGSREIHLFKDKFPFCRDCADPTCIERMRRVLET